MIKPISTWGLNRVRVVFYRFYFLKYAKFPFLHKIRFAHNLFKERRNIVLYIGFSIEKIVWTFKEKRKPKSWECDWDYSNLGILKTSTVPYINLSEKHCSKVIIFHCFESEWFCLSLGNTRTVCVQRCLDVSELLCN